MKAKCLLIIALIVSSCSNKPSKQSLDSTIQVYPISPKDGINVLTSFLFDSITYLPLETNNNTLIGSVDKLEVFDFHYYLLDKKNKKIWCYDLDGKYIFQIYKRGNGPGEYLNISDFTIDEVNKHILILDREIRKILYYDLNGNHIKSVDIEVNARNFAKLNSSFLLYTGGADIFMGKKQQKYGYNLFQTDLEGNVLSGYFPYYEITDDLWGINVFSTNKKILFHYANNDTIYEFNKNGALVCRHLFDFGKYRRPIENIKDKTTMKNYYNNPDHASISEVFHSSTYTFIRYSYERRARFLLANNITNEIVNGKFLENDIDYISFANPTPIKIDQNKLFFIKEAHELCAQKKDGNLLYKAIPLLSSLAEDDNPVITIAYLKKKQ